jgi:DNA primase
MAPDWGHSGVMSTNGDQQADIVRVIAEYLTLHQMGRDLYIGLCPFHKENGETLSVIASHGYFYCEGCYQKGDVFTFVMRREKISFREAVRVVAEKCGRAKGKLPCCK